MPLFNFNFDLDAKEKQRKLDALKATLFNQTSSTQEMAGPMMQGQQRPMITAQNQPTGLLSSNPAYAKFATAALDTPYGAQAMTGLLSQMAPVSQKPTGLMQNLTAAGVDFNTPEGQKTLLDAIMKPSTQIDMGNKFITAADAQKMRNANKEMPPIGITFDQAQGMGFKWVDPGSLKKGQEEESTIGSIEQAFNIYEGMAKEYGAMPPTARFTDPNKYRKFQGAYAALQLEFKELAKLGVLTGPDMDLIERVIQDPTSIEANAAQYFSGENPLTGQLELMREKIDAARERAKTLYGDNWKAVARTKTVKFEDLK